MGLSAPGSLGSSAHGSISRTMIRDRPAPTAPSRLAAGAFEGVPSLWHGMIVPSPGLVLVA
jgi:hypothetical protein